MANIHCQVTVLNSRIHGFVLFYFSLLISPCPLLSFKAYFRFIPPPPPPPHPFSFYQLFNIAAPDFFLLFNTTTATTITTTMQNCTTCRSPFIQFCFQVFFTFGLSI